MKEKEMAKLRAYYRKIHKYKYQLVEDYVHQLGKGWPVETATPFISILDGILTIKKHYCWDGASGPTWDTLSSMRGSLVHDALYQLIRMEKLNPWLDRENADKLFYEICLEDGMWGWRAWAWYKIVCGVAGYAAKPGTQEDKIICVGKGGE